MNSYKGKERKDIEKPQI
jgi:ATP-dependent Zn protease